MGGRSRITIRSSLIFGYPSGEGSTLVWWLRRLYWALLLRALIRSVIRALHSVPGPALVLQPNPINLTESRNQADRTLLISILDLDGR